MVPFSLCFEKYGRCDVEGPKLPNQKRKSCRKQSNYEMAVAQTNNPQMCTQTNETLQFDNCSIQVQHRRGHCQLLLSGNLRSLGWHSQICSSRPNFTPIWGLLVLAFSLHSQQRNRSDSDTIVKGQVEHNLDTKSWSEVLLQILTSHTSYNCNNIKI